jgi:glycosyltransferase involved in cell wall biosynthesis
LRILWVNQFAVPPDRGGGTRHFEIAQELTAWGHEVHIAASDYDLHRREFTRREGHDRAVVRESIDTVHFWWCWSMPYRRSDWRRIANWVTFGWQLARSGVHRLAPDVVIGSSPQLFAALGGWLVARRARAPFALEVRDLWPESLQVAGVTGGPAFALLRALARFLYRRAVRIIVLTEGVRDYLIAEGIPANRLVLAPNGVRIASFGVPDVGSRERFQVVYAGAHGAANGLELVLDAAQLLSGDETVEFVLLGDGPEKGRLTAEARRRGLSNVRFLDPIAKTEIPGFLASADCGLMILRDLPLFSFGVSPNKLFDYWAAGLPVINTVPGEVAGYVSDCGGGVQAAATPQSLVEGIRRLQSTPAERRAEMGAAGRGWVARTRDRAVVARAIESALKEIAA